MIIPLPKGAVGEDAVLQFVLAQLETHQCFSFLDAGCGDGKYTRRLVASRWMESWVVDAHRPSIEQAGGTVSICGTMPEILRPIPDRSVDAVICLDVIEHFEKPRALELIRELERIARKVVVLFTPYGFMPQEPEAENPFQEHKCGFSNTELRYLGYQTFVWELFDYGKCHHDALWAIKSVR